MKKEKEYVYYCPEIDEIEVFPIKPWTKYILVNVVPIKTLNYSFNTFRFFYIGEL